MAIKVIGVILMDNVNNNAKKQEGIDVFLWNLLWSINESAIPDIKVI